VAAAARGGARKQLPAKTSARRGAARAAAARTESGARNMVLDKMRPSDGATTFEKVSPPDAIAAAARVQGRSGRGAVHARRLVPAWD
jgi:hypothetical protein